MISVAVIICALFSWGYAVDLKSGSQKHFSPDEYGIHRNATLGDLREKIKDLAVLIGFEVMEDDRFGEIGRRE